MHNVFSALKNSWRPSSGLPSALQSSLSQLFQIGSGTFVPKAQVKLWGLGSGQVHEQSIDTLDQLAVKTLRVQPKRTNLGALELRLTIQPDARAPLLPARNCTAAAFGTRRSV